MGISLADLPATVRRQIAAANSVTKPRRKRGELKALKIARRDKRDAERRERESRLRRVNETFDFTVYCPTPNNANRSKGMHWAEMKRIADRQKESVAMALLVFQDRRPRFPVVVTMTRVSPHILDSDGLGISMKYIRDSVARWLNIDDKDSPMLKFVPAQERGSYAVRVSIAPSGGEGEDKQ